MNVTALALLFACSLVGAQAGAQSPKAWTQPTSEELSAVYPELEAVYLDLHRSPELAMHEQQTAAKLVSV